MNAFPRQPDGSVVILDRWKARDETVVLVVDPIEGEVVLTIYESCTLRGKGLMAIAENAELARRVGPTRSSVDEANSLDDSPKPRLSRDAESRKVPVLRDRYQLTLRA